MKTTCNLGRLGSSIAALAGLVVGAAGAAHPVALTGTDGAHGPQLGSGVVFTRFDADTNYHANPVLNAAGQTLFVATISGAGVTANNNTGLWCSRNGTLSLLAREGDAAPGNPSGVVFGQFGQSASPGSLSYALSPNLAENGTVAFQAALRGLGVDTSNDDALFVADPSGVVSMILRERVTELPGHPGVLFGNSTNQEMWFRQPIRLTPDGKLAIRTRVVVGGSYNEWDVTITTRPGYLETFYRGGDLMPAPWDGVFYMGAEPAMNAGGVVAQARWNSQTSTTPFEYALWSTRTGTLAPNVKAGDPVLGGGVFGGMSNVDINSSGRVAFLDRGDDAPFTYAVFSEGLYGIPVKLAANNAAAPGTGGATWCLNDGIRPIVSDGGVAVFRAALCQTGSVNSTNDLGIWANRLGLTTQLELRKGNAAPGASGAAFDDFQTLYVNAAGRVAIVATLTDGTRGLWVQGADGSYALLAKGFSTYDVHDDGSDLRLATDVIASEGDTPVWSASTGDGRRSPFNDDAAVVFRLLFIDGSEGIFTNACAPGDGDCDGRVDLADFALLVPCMAGPGATVPAGVCERFDFDADDDVDLVDFASFQAVFAQ